MACTNYNAASERDSVAPRPQRVALYAQQAVRRRRICQEQQLAHMRHGANVQIGGVPA